MRLRSSYESTLQHPGQCVCVTDRLSVSYLESTLLRVALVCQDKANLFRS